MSAPSAPVPGPPPAERPLVDWYADAARDLPWRSAQVSPWGVLVSEVMLQQTPVARVLPAYDAWLRRWPTATDLAAADAADAVRQWGRLGYPRRALRLHQCARVLTERYAGVVPADLDALLALPGIGSYTARAIASFAFGRRQAVLDTNVRRVLARAVEGRPDATGTVGRAELTRVEAALPAGADRAVRYSLALMELGALVCLSRVPRCQACPLRPGCAWQQAGAPVGPVRRRPAAFAGTDRQARGRLLARLRDATGPVDAAALRASWDEPVQRERALASLVRDGLARRTPEGCYELPHEAARPA